MANANNQNNDEKFEVFFDLISKATVNEVAGEYMSAVYLYLAAFETAKDSDKETLDNALLGLHNAWKLALGMKERPLCEHIFGILCKHLNEEDLVPYSEDLHELMIQKLEDFGLPMAGVPEDFDVDHLLGKVKDYVSSMNNNFPDSFHDGQVNAHNNEQHVDKNNQDVSRLLKEASNKIHDKLERESLQNSANDKNNNGLDSAKSDIDNLQKKENTPLKQEADTHNNANTGNLAQNQGNINHPKKNLNNKPPFGKDTFVVQKDVMRYRDLVGYDQAIHFMRSKGLGANVDSKYSQLIKKLNAEHGLERVAFSDSLIFRSKSRTDAKVFMEATAGETGLPAIHMHLDESIGGSSVLCMMAPADSNFKLNPGRTGFNGKGILILENVDTWDFPNPQVGDNLDDGMSSFIAAQISRGVAEIINLIDIAIDDPNIIVMASINDDKENEIMLRNVFGHYHIIDINYPTELERAAIWSGLANDHPSLRAFSVEKLVKYSENMSRYDINVAVHDALEDAFKQGLKKREYVPLTLLNITEKLAEHQPLESSEYKKLEDAATAEFKKSLENIDDILK